MRRLIDADEAYKVLTDYYHHGTEIQHKALKEAIERVPIADIDAITESHERIGYDRGFRDGYAEALEKTVNVPDKNVGEWIPCSERLPDKEGRYLCTVGAEFHPVREMIYEPDEFISEEDRSIWRSIDGLHVFNWFVKAWMPMPKPHKMDEVEE